MTKKCPICNQNLKDGDVVVALMLAKFTSRDDGYNLEPTAQTISSHVFCVETKKAEAK